MFKPARLSLGIDVSWFESKYLGISVVTYLQLIYNIHTANSNYPARQKPRYL